MKHRSDALALVEQGSVRVNRARAAKGSQTVKALDILTIAVHGRVHVVKVLGESERRGPPAAARLLYEPVSDAAHDGAAQKQDASLPPVC